MTNFSAVNQRLNLFAQDRWQQILAEPIPEGAVLLSNDRNEMMPMWYYQYVENRRTDLLGLFPLITPNPDFANIGRVLDQALASGRPVYLIKPLDGLSVKADIQPQGSLYKASIPITQPQNPLATQFGNPEMGSVTLLGYTVSPKQPAVGEPFTVTLFWQITQPLAHNYTSFIHVLDGVGNRIAQSDHRPGGVYYPTSLWQPDEVLRDTHLLELPDSGGANNYRLVVGLYRRPEPGSIENLADAVEIGTVFQ